MFTDLMYSPGRMEQNTEAVGSRLHAIPDRIADGKLLKYYFYVHFFQPKMATHEKSQK
jgi:hypothetical protein